MPAKKTNKSVESKETTTVSKSVESKSVEPKEEKKPKVVVKDVTDGEDNDNETEGDYDEETFEHSEEETKSSVKAKKQKASFSDLNKAIKEHTARLKELSLKSTEIEKEKNSIINKLSSHVKNLEDSHDRDVQESVKENKKTKSGRKGNVNGGFNKLETIPDILKEFLKGNPDIDSNSEMSRTKVSSALHKKFSDLGMKDGQKNTISKSMMKELKLTDKFLQNLKAKDKKDKETGEITEGTTIMEKTDNGYVFNQKYFQTFLASFYKKEDKN